MNKPMPIRVLFTPWLPNPYQRLLSDALAKQGVGVKPMDQIGPLPALARSARECSAQIVHVHWTHSFLLGNNRMTELARTAWFLNQMRRLRKENRLLFWTAHNLRPHESVWRSLENFAQGIFARECNRIIVHSESGRRLVHEAHGADDSRISVIPHGSFADVYPCDLTRREARWSLGLEESDFIFLFFGMLRPYKGLHELIDAFQSLTDSRARLLIAGEALDSSFGNRIRHIAKEDKRINLHMQFVPDSKVQNYMNAADVMVLPYREVLTSGSLVLALDFGLPVVAVDQGCIPDLVGSEEAFLFNPEKPEALKLALVSAINSERRIDQMRSNCRRKAKAISWGEIAQQTAELYRDALSETL